MFFQDPEIKEAMEMIKPCRCGHDKAFVRIYTNPTMDYYSIRCSIGFLDTGPCPTVKEAVENWNRNCSQNVQD